MVSPHLRVVVEFGIDLLMVIVNWVCVGDPVVGPNEAGARYPGPCAARLPGSTGFVCNRIAPDLDADLRTFFKVAPRGFNVESRRREASDDVEGDFLWATRGSKVISRASRTGRSFHADGGEGTGGGGREGKWGVSV